jgi:glycosyltransferase involved in cell wall biosynthesis
MKLEDIVSIRPWVSVAEARQAMQAADLLWASLGTGPESRTFVPSKLLEYIAAGRPILGFFPEGDAAELIRATGTGRVFTDDRPAPVIDTLSAMLDLAPGRTPEWYRPDREAIESYRIDSIGGRLADILENSLARSAAAADTTLH